MDKRPGQKKWFPGDVANVINLENEVIGRVVIFRTPKTKAEEDGFFKCTVIDLHPPGGAVSYGFYGYGYGAKILLRYKELQKIEGL